MDDFYSHINNNWFKKFNLPDDQVRYTSFDSVSHNVKKELIIILDDEQRKNTTLGQMYKKLLKYVTMYKIIGNLNLYLLIIYTWNYYYLIYNKCR